MAGYDQLKSTLQSNVYQNSANAVTGAVLQSTLMAFINTLGVGSGYMGLLSSGNKPTAAVDGKQFYLGMNSGSTSVVVNCSDVGLGNITITQRTLWVVWSDGTGWHKQDLAAGLSAVIPTNVNQLKGYENLQEKEAYIKDGGSVTIDKLESNTAYYLKGCDSLDVLDYGYDIADPQNTANLPETHLFVYVNSSFDVTVPAGSVLRSGDSLSLTGGEIYLITVKYNFWKVEKYS